MPSPFAETYNSPADVPFAANVAQILLTSCINKEPVPTKIVRQNNRKVVPRVKLPQIVILKPVSKL
jgi:hypothetical protein